MEYPKEYDIIKVNGMVPDWVDDFDNAYFGSPDDYWVIDLTDENVSVQFFKLIEINQSPLLSTNAKRTTSC